MDHKIQTKNVQKNQTNERTSSWTKSDNKMGHGTSEIENQTLDIRHQIVGIRHWTWDIGHGTSDIGYRTLVYTHSVILVI